jgi:hypothetical protein
MYTSSIV